MRASSETLKFKQSVQHLANTGFPIEQLLSDWGRCSECNSQLAERGGDYVCTQCGCVANRVYARHTIPLGELRTPTIHLAKGNNLGNTLHRKGQYLILANARRDGSPQELANLPISASHIRNINEASMDHPKLASIKRYATARLAEWALNDNHELRDHLGKLVTKIGWFKIQTEERVPLRQIADGCFIIALRDSFGDERAAAAFDTLNFPANVLREFQHLRKTLLPAKEKTTK